METFKDLMMTTRGEEAKKKVILDLFANKENLVTDDKFQFSFNSDIIWLLSSDMSFYLEAMKILRPKLPFNKELYLIAYNNRTQLLQ